MKKRPLIVRLLSIFYLLAPLWILLEFKVFFDVNVLDSGDWYYILSYHVGFMTILTMLAGYGMYKVRPWGFYLVILHSIIVILNNSILLYKGITPLNVYWTLGFNLFMVLIVILFLRKEVYSPYFNPRLRWWEQAKRFMTDGLMARFYLGRTKLGEFEVFDLSETGIFIKIDDLSKIDMKKQCSILLPFLDTGIKAQIMWINTTASKIPLGAGLRFDGITKKDKKKIRDYIKKQSLKERAR